MAYPSSVTACTTFRLLGDAGPERSIDAELCYDSRNPYAVSITFSGPHRTVEWTFARDLLADGMLAPSGVGDVHVRPGVGTDLVLDLYSPAGAATLCAHIADIAEFVITTYELVPSGHEELGIDFDAELAKL
jgi:hypothetical protein